MENFGTDKATGERRTTAENPVRPMDEEESGLFNIRVKVREVYGVRRVYVQSFHLGPLKKLTGRETLTDSDISALKALGYTVQAEAEAVTL